MDRPPGTDSYLFAAIENSSRGREAGKSGVFRMFEFEIARRRLAGDMLEKRKAFVSRNQSALLATVTRA